MVYNPIFEEELDRSQELVDLKKAIKLRASKELFDDVLQKSKKFVTNHPIFTTLVLGIFGIGLKKKSQ